jgi:hypothetical protein
MTATFAEDPGWSPRFKTRFWPQFAVAEAVPKRDPGLKPAENLANGT